jgi:Prokaryotic homologs of the JAB domain
MMRLVDVEKVVVKRRDAQIVHKHLRDVGRQGYEGLGLWVGRQNGPVFQVDQAVIPAQRHIRTADGVCVITGAEELHRINVWLYRNGLSLIAQIHSHPGRAYHSSTDDEFAVATTVGCFSLVVPDFASGVFDIGRLASYRLDGSGHWREIAPSRAAQTIVIED